MSRTPTALRPHEGPLALLATVLEIVVVAVFVATFVATPSRIPSASMEPTLQVGDLVLIDRQSYAPTGRLDLLLPPSAVSRGDMAVFWRLEAASAAPADAPALLVKRVVGVPGDVIRMRAGGLERNGAPVGEPYAIYARVAENPYRNAFPSLREADPAVDPLWWAYLRRQTEAHPGAGVTVPGGAYFVLGDNRNNSEDSRYWGFVPTGSMMGRPVLVYWRPGRGWVGRLR